MNEQGYYRFPAVRGNIVVFESEDDLWQVSLQGGVASRITANLSNNSVPKVSPDGKHIAYVSSEEGYGEIFVKEMRGSGQKRLTFLGASAKTLGWTSDSKSIIFTSNYEQPFESSIYKISIKGGEPEKYPVGYANRITIGKKGVLIGRNNQDSARWKRYRGGTAGKLWIDEKGDGNFKPFLKDLDSNLNSPMWIDSRIYFVSDHEGIANIYSVNPKGKDIKRHTDHDEYYVRNADTDGKTIVYHSGADIYSLKVGDNKSKKINVEYVSSQTQILRKFIDATKYFQGADISAKGTHIALAARGKAVSFANWTGPVIQVGKKDSVRYRHPTWLFDNKRFVTVSDEYNNEDRILIVDPLKNKETLLKDISLGRVRRIFPSPKTDEIVILNNRNEAIWINLKKKTSKVLDKSDHFMIWSVAWSPDAKWITYSFINTPATSIIKVLEVSTGKSHVATETVGDDNNPVFSEDGKYIFFISERTFNPVNDAVHFELSFVKASKIYALPLLKETKSPFILDPKSPSGENEEDEKKKENGKKDDKKKEIEVKIDFEGIEKRILEFPIQTSKYGDLFSFGRKIIYTERVEAFNETDKGYKSNLKTYDLDQQKEETVIEGIDGFTLSLDRKSMLVKKEKELLALKSGVKPDDKVKNKKSLEGGGIDLSRIKIGIIPREEWKQMFREAWLLQREHFWTADMSKIDWVKVYERYYPLLERLGSRGEFSDLIWEMQGELGTSHCYEWGGDYRDHRNYKMGKLGCSYKLSKDGKYYTIENILYGDSSSNIECSPLLRPGINIKNGDSLLAVNGTKVSKNTHPRELLVNLSEQDVILTFLRKGKKKKEDIVVKALGLEYNLRYRNWVENNRAYVHKKSKGKTGYVHIPDMGNRGFSEFHRLYLSECQYDSMIVDVRYNGGGYVSQLILEKLNRKVIGYDTIRWSKEAETYPSHAVEGTIVALTNELAGSDGDIFSHSFKMMKLGKLVGKRTWGGVIGINGQYSLADGSGTTQPEYSFWFKDVEWGVENYGTDPDIEVDIKPQDYVKGKDPQLDKALEVALEGLKKNPVIKPKFDKRPNLSLPKLPKRK
ncbi:MAG: S41 family peptidase [Candidatus Delongbacteria bacterium]|jgi:tricorn protease|nr:S41 family peptidase [Candidatus Delongbacteria bacterium]